MNIWTRLRMLGLRGWQPTTGLPSTKADPSAAVEPTKLRIPRSQPLPGRRETISGLVASDFECVHGPSDWMVVCYWTRQCHPTRVRTICKICDVPSLAEWIRAPAAATPVSALRNASTSRNPGSPRSAQGWTFVRSGFEPSGKAPIIWPYVTDPEKWVGQENKAVLCLFRGGQVEVWEGWVQL